MLSSIFKALWIPFAERYQDKSRKILRDVQNSSEIVDPDFITIIVHVLGLVSSSGRRLLKSKRSMISNIVKSQLSAFKDSSVISTRTSSLMATLGGIVLYFLKIDCNLFFYSLSCTSRYRGHCTPVPGHVPEHHLKPIECQDMGWNIHIVVMQVWAWSDNTWSGQSVEFERRIINLQTGNYRVSQKIVLLSGFEILTMEGRGVFRGNIFRYFT